MILFLAVVVSAALFPRQRQAALTEATNNAPVYAVGFSGSQPRPWVNQLFCGVREYSLVTGQLTAEWPAFSRSLCDVARGGTDVVTTVLADSNGELRIIRDETPVLTYRNVATADGSTPFSDASVSVDGNIVVATQQRGCLLKWTWTGNEFHLQKTNFPLEIEGVRISPDSRYLLLGVNSRRLLIWDHVNRREVAQFVAHGERITQIHWMPDGKSFCTGGDDGFVRCWDLDSQKLVWEVRADTLAPTSLAIAADQSEIAVGGFDKLIRVYDARTGKILDELKGHTGPIRGMAFDPANTVLVSADLKGSIYVWSKQARRLIRKLM